MSEGNRSPILFKARLRPLEDVFDETVLGTPVPVAHSTVSQKGKQRTFLIPAKNAAHNAMPLLEHTSTKVTTIIEPIPKPDSCNNSNGSASILNINSIPGLSGSVLEPSLNAAPAGGETAKVVHRPPSNARIETPPSVEGSEGENMGVELDKAELQRLEEDFSDLECLTSGAEETLPTKACAIPLAGDSNSQRDQLDGSATTVSSLQSATHNSNKMEPVTEKRKESIVSTSKPDWSRGNQPEQSRKPVDAEYRKRSLIPTKKVPPTNPLLRAILDAQISASPVEGDKNVPDIARLTGLSSTLGIESSGSGEMPAVQASTASCKSKKAETSSFTGSPGGCRFNDSTKVSSFGPIAYDADPPNNRPVQEHSTINPTNEGHTDLEQSSTFVSCLHMSDIDGLLDKMGVLGTDDMSNVHTPTAARRKHSAPVSFQLTKRSIAEQRAIRLRLKQMAVPKCGLIKSAVPNGVTSLGKENHPPVVCPQDQSKSSPTSDLNLPHPVSRVSLHSAPGEKQRSPTEGSDAGGQEQKIQSANSCASQKISHPCPLLSNTDSLIWCGAICGQVHRQHLLIKHQQDNPVTIRLFISRGNDAFKISDERGSLFTGAVSIRLPPNLEYTVHVGYDARHPFSWDVGQLQLAVDEPTRSVWKVRLIGYTSRSQLECSCCTRLSSTLYWTTAFRCRSKTSDSIKQQFSPSLRGQLISHGNAFQSTVTSVVLTNFGDRAAWVVAFLELPEKIDSSSADDRTKSFIAAFDPLSGVTVEPGRMVIASKQSASVMITLPQNMNSARVLFFYGDEVLRHQYRQHYALPGKPSSEIYKDSHRQRPQVKRTDLMTYFKNETPFQIVEVPPSLRHPIRPEDWRKALSQQLRSREHLTLNIYAQQNEETVVEDECRADVDGTVVTDRRSQKTTTRSDSSATLASIFVQEEAFRNRRSATSVKPDEAVEICDSGTQDSHRVDEIVTQLASGSDVTGNPYASHLGLLPSSAPLRLKLDPPNTLVFPSCAAADVKSDGSFSLTSVHTLPSNMAWRLMWLAHPVSDVRHTDADQSCTQNMRVRGLNDECVFYCASSKKNIAYRINEQHPRGPGQGDGLLTSDVSSSSVIIPFVFHPPSLKGLYLQDWCLTVWLQPTSQQLANSEAQRNFETTTSVDPTGVNTLRYLFSVTMEGQRTYPLSPKAPVTSMCTTTSLTQQSPLSRPMERPVFSNHLTQEHPKSWQRVGPLIISGLPVVFNPVDGKSATPSSSYQLTITNSLKDDMVFVKLGPPQPPFHIVRPNETRFRILPNRCVHVHLAFCPTESGSASSSLRVEAARLSASDPHSLSNLNKLEIPLAGSSQQ
ncbi:unnamed protein product [Calicophoron daubneyi]|uniref:Centrosomal protein of 192 kDa n=1 Tax=Calicophoron daubneyi TaxID=300641 RepID=A0AAV2T9U8_CALDB